jgi:hypothetical protein
MNAEEATRVRLGARPDTAPEVLRGLVADGSVTVRSALAMNSATEPETNAALAADPDERVRLLLARKLSMLAPALSGGAMTRLRQQALATLIAMAEDETERVRAAIAEAVKDLPDVPRAAILRLAHDSAAAVCEPVIRFSSLLTSDDLVALVAAAPSGGTCVAVARRLSIDDTVSEAVASGGTDDAVLALLMNRSAQIREATIDALVERSIDHPAWHDPLVRRPALSTRSTRMLALIVADQLLEIMAARTDLDPVMAADLRARVAANLERDPATQPANAPVENPTEADLLGAARAGDTRTAAVMLAQAAHVPLPVVLRAATLRSAKGLLSLVWKAGFSMHAGYAMEILLARLSPGAALKAGPGNSYPLSAQEMCWQVDFLSGKDR